jgi:glycosyltransferase involved in cell wall biosynthesis
MKVGIVALNYFPGTAGGIESYFHDLLQELQRLDQSTSYVIFASPKSIDAISLQSPNFIKIPVEEDLIIKTLRKFRLTRLVQYSGLAKQIEGHNCDVLHFPLQVMIPSRIKGKVVLSCMDLQQEYLPEMFSVHDLEARRNSYRPSVERADHVIAISDFTKHSIAEKYNINPDKITTVHLAHEAQIYNATPVKTSVSLPRPYFYYPAATWPHKNHLRLLEAFAKFEQLHPDFSMVFSGIKMQATNEIERKIKELNLDGKVLITGYLPRVELPALYQKACALVFPSLFEGFGIPLVEAMACGCPILCSKVTSLPEIAKNTAVYFDPYDIDDMASKMEELVLNQGLREKLISYGYERAKFFSNKKMAQATLRIYEQVASE